MTQVLQRPCPFPGLRAFETVDRQFFFGRERQISQLYEKLIDNRFVAVVGSSGSGKSSLVRAGLIGRLIDLESNASGSPWRCLVLRPQNDPLNQMARAMAIEQTRDVEDIDQGRVIEPSPLLVGRAESVLRRSSQGLTELLDELEVTPSARILIVIDQFEELFSFNSHEFDERDQFVKQLLTASQAPQRRYHILLTMRSEFLGECTQFWGLPEAINESQFLTPRMTREQRKEAIVGPLLLTHKHVSHALLERLLNDAGNEPDQLPVLQHSLMRTWQFSGTSDQLSLSHYESAGSMDRAISNHANQIFMELTFQQQNLVERIFRSLTERDEQGRNVRRPISLGVMQAEVSGSEMDLLEVVELFRRTDCAFLLPPPSKIITRNTTIDISHEALIRKWDRMPKWINEEQEAGKTYRSLSDRAREGRYLLTPPEAKARSDWWEKINPTEVWASRYGGYYPEVANLLTKSRAEADTKNQLSIESQLVNSALDRQFDAGAIYPVSPYGGLMHPTASVTPTASELANPVAESSRVGELFALIQQAASGGDQPNASTTQRYIRELHEEIARTGQPLSAGQSQTLLAVVADPRFLPLNQAGPDVLTQVDAVKAVLHTVPVDKVALETVLGQLHRDLGDARLQVPLATAKGLLRILRNARQFDHLSRVADRLITRDPALLGTLSVPYAQGLIDGGRLIAGIEVLTAAEQSGQLTTDEAAEVDGLLGRAHKQIYLNFVRTQRDALLLGKAMGPHLAAAIVYYAKRYDPAHPGDTYYHGINYIGLISRARRDGVRTAIKGDPVELSRAIISAIEPTAEIGSDIWQIVTLGEAYLATGDLENAAKWYARFAKHPNVTAFELNSAIRQLEEVWQLSAEQTGAGAIVTGLKTVLAHKDGGSVTLKPKEQRVLANTQHVQFQEHFETKTEGGDYINFGLLKQIVHCGDAVAAVQKQLGQSWVNHGTAFLVKGSDFSSDLSDEKSYLLTNAHVMWDFDQPGDGNSVETSGSPVDWRQARIVFESQQSDGRSEPYECARIVWQSPSTRHDAVLFELREAVPRERAVPLAMAGRDFPLRTAGPGGASPTRLSVLGHPGGRELALSFVGSIQQNNAILVDKGPRDASGEPVFLHYSTPTDGGNSGSPVFSADTWRVVALHHAGFPDQGRPKLGGKAGSNLANEGIWIESIRAAVKEARSAKESNRPRWWRKAQ